MHIGKNQIYNFDEVFPTSFYYSIGKDKISLTATIRLSNLVVTSQSSQHTFDLVGYIVDKEFLDEYNMNQSIEIQGEKISIATTSSGYTISIDMDTGEQNYRKFVLVKITQAKTNCNEYVEGKITVRIEYSSPPLPKLSATQLGYGNLKEPASFIVDIGGGCTTGQIELSAAPNKFDYLEKTFEIAFEVEKDIPMRLNTTSLKLL